MAKRSNLERGGSRGIVLNGISLRGERRLATSLLVLAIVLSVGVSLRYSAITSSIGLPLRALGVIVTVASSVSLLLLRRRPYLLLGVNVVAISIERIVFNGSFFVVSFLFAFVIFAIRVPQRRIVIASATSFVYFAITSLFVNSFQRSPYDIGIIIGQIPLVVPIAAFSLWIGTNTKYLAELKARSEISERERELLAERAVADERVRIARDLHDIVAHHVSLMVVQIGAVSSTIRPNDPKAASQLDQVGDLGREAMGEMRRMLNLLRNEVEISAPVRPAPTATDVVGLVARANEAGADVSFKVVGQKVELQESLETTIYRISQESVTNIVKHATDARGTLVIEYRPDRISIVATNSYDSSTRTSEIGRGLEGLRERVSLFDGEVTVADDRGQFVVSVLLPSMKGQRL
ncbi:MAG: histidine kinase [Actinomycetota bacterium]|nr:histidine kinase [Actinomycetota bacterium]